MVPSVAKYYTEFLQARIETAYLVSLALEGPESEMIDEETADQLFSTSNILGVGVTRDGAHFNILSPTFESAAAPTTESVNLRSASRLSLVNAAWECLFSRGEEVIAVAGAPMRNRAETVDILVSKSAVRRSLNTYAGNILWLSLIISALTAAFIYRTLNRLIVDPVKQMRVNMAAFEKDPQGFVGRRAAGDRIDEIGDAERGLFAMTDRIRTLLEEQRRLAALGAGISKISHDLRNILASAQLMSDRLARSDDPRVRKLSPRLISSLDRAITLSNDTLNYGRMNPDSLRLQSVDLARLVDEVFDDCASFHIDFFNDVPSGASVKADKTQLYRALFNVTRNAVDALAPPVPEAPTDGALRQIRARYQETPDCHGIDLADNGPGLPEAARTHLFEPFKGSRKPGGSGLGLAIAHEIARAHSGDLVLAKSDRDGATFRLTLPKA